jgi:hypothetical protein
MRHIQHALLCTNKRTNCRGWCWSPVKVYTLPEYAIGASAEEGIPDPYGHTIATFRASVRELLDYIDKLVGRLEREEVAITPIAFNTCSHMLPSICNQPAAMEATPC